MNVKKLIYNYLSNGVVQFNNSELNRQIPVANLLGLISYTITLIMSVSAFIRQDI